MKQQRIVSAVCLAGALLALAIVPVAANHLRVTTSDIVNGTIQPADFSGRAVRYLQTGALRSGAIVRGVIGGDYEGFTATAGGPCEDNCDWAGYASLPFPSRVGLGDDDVLVDVTTSQSPVTADADEAGSAAACTGSLSSPTAPPGKVCIYVTDGDNAVDVKGVSVRPGTGESKFGFKLVWVSTTDDDTFIDAIWAYREP